MTRWEKWIEELKTLEIDKVNFICNCGLYDDFCNNIVTQEKCPLFYSQCRSNKLGDIFLNEEVKETKEEKSKLAKAKEIIKEYYKKADCGIFCTRNTAGDIMHTIYDEDGLTIDICYNYAYFEVFGLDAKDYKELRDYYINLVYREE